MTSLEEGKAPFELHGDWNTRPQEARLSPDGSLLAYTSIQSGREEIYVRSVAASASLRERETNGIREKWKISGFGGREPAWRRDGKELFYVTPDQLLGNHHCRRSILLPTEPLQATPNRLSTEELPPIAL